MLIDSTDRWAYGVTRGDQTKVYRSWLHSHPYYHGGYRMRRSHVTCPVNVRTNCCAQRTRDPVGCIQGALYAIGDD
jgi:hypothetical protein